MDKLKINKEIYFNEENLLNILDQLLCDCNIDRYGEETNTLVTHVHTFIQSNEIDPNVQFDLCDYCNEIATRASTYGFEQGFKEGVRLFRTLMKI